MVNKKKRCRHPLNKCVQFYDRVVIKNGWHYEKAYRLFWWCSICGAVDVKGGGTRMKWRHPEMRNGTAH